MLVVFYGVMIKTDRGNMEAKKDEIDYNELKDIEGYEGLYAVTRSGKVWSYPKEWVVGNGSICNHNGKWLISSSVGYRTDSITLYRNNVDRSLRISFLVATTYLQNPDKKKYVCHIDKNVKNNYIDNLAWCDESDNLRFRMPSGIGKRKNSRKIGQYTKDNIYIKYYDSVKSASIDNGIITQKISACLNGRAKLAGHYLWKYED